MSAIPGYLEISEAALRLHKSYPQVAKYVRDGDLPCVKVGSTKLIPENAVDKFKPRPVGNPDFQKQKKTRRKKSA